MRTKRFAVHALGLPVVAVSLLAGCESGGGTIVGGSEVVAAEVKVAVAPPVVALAVGQTAQLVAVVANVPAGAPAGVRWTSTDVAVASVSAQSGVVSCNGAGSAMVFATAEASEAASGRSAVTCTPAAVPPPRPEPTPAPTPVPTPAPTPTPPPPPVNLVAVNASLLSFQDRAFVDSCPLNVGAFTVKNTSQERIRVEMQAGHDSLELTPGSWELQPGQEAPHPVNVRFNCTARSSFTTHITITARASGASQTRRIEVRGTIQ